MANSIASTKNYTSILDEVYKRAACSTCLNSPRRMARAGRNAVSANLKLTTFANASRRMR